MLDFVEATTFPISMCHSQNDDIVPYGNTPTDFSANPLLSELTVFGESPSRGHFESSAFCYTAFVFQFTDFFGSAPTALKGISPLPDPTMCQAVAPTTSTTAISIPTLSPTETPVSSKLNNGIMGGGMGDMGVSKRTDSSDGGKKRKGKGKTRALGATSFDSTANRPRTLRGL